MVSLIDNLLFFIFATDFKMFISLKKFILFKACEIVTKQDFFLKTNLLDLKKISDL